MTCYVTLYQIKEFACSLIFFLQPVCLYLQESHPEGRETMNFFFLVCFWFLELPESFHVLSVSTEGMHKPDINIKGSFNCVLIVETPQIISSLHTDNYRLS